MLMTTVSALANTYAAAINSADRAGFRALFADSAQIDDNGRKLQGIVAIEEWANREIFAAQVSLQVLESAMNDGEALVTAIVDGNFDRTGLPDPVVISHRIEMEAGQIVALTCRLCEVPIAKAGR
jgi:hypothetical protein